MKFSQIIILVWFLVAAGWTKPYRPHISKVTKLKTLLQAAEHDRKQKIERLAAIKFHKLIIEYRIKNGVDALEWDESLWITSRNHSIWMGENEILAHHETKGTKYFTGVKPGDRYEYTTSDKGTCSWSGENALYNYSNEGKTIEEISINIATHSLNQWKHSPGHNQNMLAKGSKAHGVAFYLNKEGVVYATDLFAYNSDN